jgi:hypothetical protein
MDKEWVRTLKKEDDRVYYRALGLLSDEDEQDPLAISRVYRGEA